MMLLLSNMKKCCTLDKRDHTSTSCQTCALEVLCLVNVHNKMDGCTADRCPASVSDYEYDNILLYYSDKA